VIRQIKKQLPVFIALIVLLIGALGVTAYLLSNQRFYLPAWVPGIGTDFYEVEAELPTAQAVVPGQGQTVNVAGVKVGEVGEVNLENGRAVVSLQIKDKYKPISTPARPRRASSRRAAGSRWPTRCPTSTRTRCSRRSTPTPAPTSRS
jgi:ABC-type transporter Mla subunit MlaD